MQPKTVAERGRGLIRNPQPWYPRKKAFYRASDQTELVRLTPKLKPYLRQPDPTWPDIIEAADWLRQDLGVSKSLWGDACLTMGRELAAASLAVVSTKNDEHFRTSPGGYFHGMVAKAKVGELHLERTLWALRRVTTPEHPAGREERRIVAKGAERGKVASWRALAVTNIGISL
ncbi:MAG: hypothetical protein J2P48_15480 [Alphaproteobacteria bacterium]|nr:hypothetical protein [Alphaproteobacteria bacterium]